MHVSQMVAGHRSTPGPTSFRRRGSRRRVPTESILPGGWPPNGPGLKRGRRRATVAESRLAGRCPGLGDQAGASTIACPDGGAARRQGDRRAGAPDHLWSSGHGRGSPHRDAGAGGAESSLRVAWFALGQGRPRGPEPGWAAVVNWVGRSLRAALLVVTASACWTVSTDSGRFRFSGWGQHRGAAQRAGQLPLHSTWLSHLVSRALATATIDRPIRHVRLCATSGKDVRTTRATPQ